MRLHTREFVCSDRANYHSCFSLVSTLPLWNGSREICAVFLSLPYSTLIGSSWPPISSGQFRLQFREALRRWQERRDDLRGTLEGKTSHSVIGPSLLALKDCTELARVCRPLLCFSPLGPKPLWFQWSYQGGAFIFLNVFLFCTPHSIIISIFSIGNCMHKFCRFSRFGCKVQYTQFRGAFFCFLLIWVKSCDFWDFIEITMISPILVANHWCVCPL